MSSARFAFAFAAALLAVGVAPVACSPSNNHTGGTGAGSAGTGGGASTSTGTGNGTGTGGNGMTIPSQICLLHNCSSDVDCAGCTGGHTSCLVSQHRCVACSAGGTTGCPSGQVCSSAGNCTPPTVTCPTTNGIPTITCNTSADCAACDPAHLVCDTTAHKCVACTAADTSQCQTTDSCNGGDCAPKCPATCATDADCSQCGTGTAAAHHCNGHKCSQCAAGTTSGCDTMSACSLNGTCEKVCGAPGQPKGVCKSDSDCAACDGGATKCNGIPIGGGTGKCGPSVPGCSDLGKGVAVLPAPFDKVTNLCSHDADCASVGVNLNVGAILRDLTGWSQIHDATIMYPEHVCASVELQGTSCGVCVPCKVDSDCQSIPVDQVVGQAFGPLGTVATDFLLDQIFGPNDHSIHMYCQGVADGYGVCAPCPGIVNACGVGMTPPSTGTCSSPHPVCMAGGALDPSCGSCELSVCTNDPYCCSVEWDASCVGEVPGTCNQACDNCVHDRCATGGPLDPACSECVASICQGKPDCCATAWDSSCVGAIPAYCPKLYLCQSLHQCKDASDCPSSQGCLATYTCGPCMHDYDCLAGQTCNTTSGTCQ